MRQFLMTLEAIDILFFWRAKVEIKYQSYPKSTEIYAFKQKYAIVTALHMTDATWWEIGQISKFKANDQSRSQIYETNCQFDWNMSGVA